MAQDKDREKEKKKSAIETDDFANRTFFGSPTIGGVVVCSLFTVSISVTVGTPRM
ncbi:MAG: hypothetical protein ACE3JP_02745 [Ectobacillus sp.]